MRCDLDHRPRPVFAGQLKISSLELMLRSFYYLVVLTIARRREPFANCKETRVSLELIGENFTILPVTPVLLVVNKSPIWYVYPLRVICFSFVCGGLYYLILLDFDGGVKYPPPSLSN
jgi:hypothetical protein